MTYNCFQLAIKGPVSMTRNIQSSVNTVLFVLHDILGLSLKWISGLTYIHIHQRQCLWQSTKAPDSELQRVRAICKYIFDNALSSFSVSQSSRNAEAICETNCNSIGRAFKNRKLSKLWSFRHSSINPCIGKKECQLLIQTSGLALESAWLIYTRWWYELDSPYNVFSNSLAFKSKHCFEHLSMKELNLLQTVGLPKSQIKQLHSSCDFAETSSE